MSVYKLCQWLLGSFYWVLLKNSHYLSHPSTKDASSRPFRLSMPSQKRSLSCRWRADSASLTSVALNDICSWMFMVKWWIMGLNGFWWYVSCALNIFSLVLMGLNGTLWHSLPVRTHGPGTWSPLVSSGGFLWQTVELPESLTGFCYIQHDPTSQVCHRCVKHDPKSWWTCGKLKSCQ